MSQSHSDLVTADVARIAHLLLRAKGDFLAARAMARSEPTNPRVLSILEKAAVDGLGTNDGAGGTVLGEWRYSSLAFFGTLRTASVFFRLLDSGLRRVPLRTHVGIIATAAVGYIVGEAKPIPVSTIDLTAGDLAPVTAAALIVVSDELVRSADPAAASVINSEMRTAVSAAADTRFWELVDPTDLGASAGTFEADTAALLSAVNTTATGPLVWAMSADVANLAAAHDENMSPLGGELLNLPAMVSSVIPAGTLRLVNAAAIAGNADGLALDASNQAAIEMDSSPADPSAATSVITSMWQTNRSALRCIVSFAVQKVRDNAAAEITGITWAAA